MNKFFASIQENKIGILFMTIAALSTSTGQLFWKLSGGAINLSLIIGFFIYFLGAVFMIVAYKFGSLSVLHPFLSLGYIFAMAFGTIFLHEVITLNMLIGTCLILFGVLLIGGGDH